MAPRATLHADVHSLEVVDTRPQQAIEEYFAGSRKRRWFVQAAYAADAQGVMRAVIPTRCPLGGDGSACQVTGHDHRERKSGPEHALAVCRCRGHGASFTIYPPGHVPYGRVAVVAVDSEGRVIQGDALGQTIFGAARDASVQRVESEAPGGERVSRRTVARRLSLCASLLGICAGMTDGVRGRIGEALRVAHLTLREGAARYASSSSLRGRALAVLDVLERLRAWRGGAGVLVAGQAAGVWGRASRWNAGAKMLRPLV